MPAKLKAAQSKTTERDLPPSGSVRQSVRRDMGDRYSDVAPGMVEVVAPATRPSNLPATLGEPYDLESALSPHLGWLEDDGRADLFGHLKRGDHGRALAMLTNAAKRYPRIVSITRAIQLVERGVIARLTKRIGDFDAIAVVAGRPGPSHESISLAALIDGSRTIDEIVRMSSLPRLRTLELLDDLLRRGAVEVRDPYVQSSAKGISSDPARDAPPRNATPQARRAVASSRPASVPPQRLAPFGGLKGVRKEPLAAALAAAAMREIPDLDEDVGARVTMPGPLPEALDFGAPSSAPPPRAATPSPGPVAHEDDGPSIAVEAIPPSSTPRSDPNVEESAREEGLPAVLAFGLLSLPVRSQSPSSPRPLGESTPTPTSAVDSTLAMTEPNPTLVTPRDADAEKKAARVKMETLKSAPSPEVLRAAEKADREARAAVEVRSARKHDLEQTTESEVEAPKPPSVPPLAVKASAPSAARAEPAKSDPPATPAAFELETSEAPTRSKVSSLRPEPAGAVAAAPEVRTIVREATPRWFMPVMVLVGVALIGSGIAVYLSLRTAAEPPPTQEHVATPPAPPEPTTATKPAEAPSAAPTAPPPPGVVRLRVDVTPRAARVTLDKVLLTAHPIDETLPRDGKEHELRAELAGYETYTQTFKGDGEINVVVRLKQLVVAPVTPTVPTQTPSAPVTPHPKPSEEVYPTP